MSVTDTAAGEPRVGWSPAREAAAVLGILTLVTLLVTWPLATSIGTHLPGDLRDPLFNTWILAWDAYALGTFQNVWNAPIFFPYTDTLAYSEHLIGVGWPLAPIFWLTGNPLVLYNVAFLLSYVLAGAGMYLLVRTLTGRADAALVAALVYAFCPYRWIQFPHLQMLMWGWLPVSAWALHEYFRTRSRKRLAVAVLSYALLGLSNGYLLFFGAIAIGLIALHDWRRRRSPLTRTVIDGALACGVLAAVFVPVARAYARAGLTQSWAHSAGEIGYHSATLSSYLTVLPHIRFWAWLPFDSTGGETALFPGVTSLVLAAAALWSPSRDGRYHGWAWLYAAIAAAGAILSFGPHPTFWGHDTPLVWPYGWLVASVPGFGALRVPARAASLVFFALAVLAGFGASRLLRDRSPRTRWITLAMLAPFIVVEGFGGPLPVSPFRTRSPRPERSAYAWVREGPPGGAIELPPEGELMADGRSDLYYQFHTVFHGRPIVNGSSRFEPPLTTFFKGAPSPLREIAQLPDVPRMLRSFGVRHVIIRPTDYKNRNFGQATVDMFRSSADVTEHRRFGAGLTALEVFRLRDPFTPLRDISQTGWRPVPAAAFRVSASERADRIHFAADGDPGTRWISAGAQDGSEMLELELDRSRDLARVRLDLGSSHGDYPRGLEVSALDAQGQVAQVLYTGSILPQLAAGILADPFRTPIAIDLPPNRARRFRIRQTGTTRTWSWAVEEIALWER